MGRWEKMKRMLAGAAAVVFLAAQMPLDALADTDAGVETGDVDVAESVSSGNEAEEENTAVNEEIAVQAGEGVRTGYVNGTDRTVSWTYDPETKTTVVTGIGTRSTGYSGSFPSETEYIRFENCEMGGSFAGLFSDLQNLLYVDFTGLIMTNTTDMGSMFSWCYSLTSLIGVENFDTSQVTNMGGMFYFCESLTSLNVENFDTSQVTDMKEMFFSCESLTSLNVENFDTSQVTDMYRMFCGCGSLTSLRVENFDTSQVTDMSEMFSSCHSLTNLSVENFDTSQVTDMNGMFSGCGSLTSLSVENFDTSQVTNMKDMFLGCSSLTSLNVENFDTSQVTDMYGMFLGCSSLTSLNVENFDTSQVATMRYMFARCSSLTSLDLRNFDTSHVASMLGMFSDCSSLKSLDVGNFDTSHVVTMENMFSGCSNLTSLNLRNFDTSQVVGGWLSDMFSCCSNLKIIQTPMTMGSATADLPGTYSDPEGNLTTELTAAFAGTTLTKQEDVQTGYVDGTNNMVSWTYDPETKTTVVTGTGTRVTRGYAGSDSVFPAETEHIRFENCEIEMSYAWLFSGLQNLISIDFTGLTMSNVTDMRQMFSGCSNLANLNLENFDTGQVTNMYGMFFYCSSLTNLDLSSFDTSQVVEMGRMFEGCSCLIDLNLENFDTSQVARMESMFSYCRSLTNLHLENFDTSQVPDMECMFFGCSSLENLDASNFNTSQVTNMRGMFEGCSSLMSLNVGNFDTKQVTDMGNMFYGCSSLENLNLENFDTSQVTDMYGMFWGCSSLTSLDLSNFDTSQVIDMYGMYLGCSSLTSLNLSSFDMSQVTNTYYDIFMMLDNCYNLQILQTPMTMGEIVPNLPSTYSDPEGNLTTKLTAAFAGTTLTRQDTQIGYTGYVDGTNEMVSWTYAPETKTTTVTGAGTRTGGSGTSCFLQETEHIRFENCEMAGSYDDLFHGLRNLVSIDFTGLVSANVTSMNSMFYDCSGLTILNLGSFDISQVTNMSHMFFGCSNLAKIYTPYATTMPSAEPPQLPSAEVDGIVWRDPDGTEVTELPLGLPSSILLTRYSASDSPAITTTTTDLNMDDVIRVKYVPYSYTVRTDNENEWNQVTFSIVEGRLADGLMMYPVTGEIYGVPLEAGEFKVTVMATYSIPEYVPSYAELTLIVLENTDENVGTASDAGYEIIQPVPDLDLGALPADGGQLLVSEGEYAQFQDIYLDGVKLIKGVEYTAEPGSTRVTIQNQTLSGTGAGIHTIGIEFRTPEDNTLMRAAQNVEITVADDSEGTVPDNGDTDEYILEETTVTFIYTVMPGDNLWKISVKFYGTGTLWTRIYKDNAAVIRDPNRISVGQKLTITLAATGSSTMTSSESGEQAAENGTTDNSKVRVYRVMPGDTLWNISRKAYGNEWLWEKIYQANRHKIMSPRYLRVGLEIVIPER